ncbi:hypothetical protein Hanom_Chr11g00970211 [Helianthus anomalus]
MYMFVCVFRSMYADHISFICVYSIRTGSMFQPKNQPKDRAGCWECWEDEPNG